MLELISDLADRLRPAGFDLVCGLNLDWYHSAVDAAYHLPRFGRQSCLAAVIGNSKALWEPFCRALAADPALAAERDPIDRYTEAVITGALRAAAVPWEVRFSYEAPPRRVAMQRLAHVAGLAYLTPSYLSVHPVYGPWIGLRAAVVFDCEGPGGTAPVLAPPCQCEAGCGPVFRQALAQAAGEPRADGWRAWVGVRDACPAGRAYRYSEDQIGYHYTKQRKYLPALPAR